MLQKNKSCRCNDISFEKSEQLFQDKMNTWNTCSCKKPCKDDNWCDDWNDPQDDLCPMNPNPCDDYPLPTPPMPDDCPKPRPPFPIDPCDDQVLAMAYVKNQTLDTKSLKNYRDALRAGTLFDDLDLPFVGGRHHD